MLAHSGPKEFLRQHIQKDYLSFLATFGLSGDQQQLFRHLASLSIDRDSFPTIAQATGVLAQRGFSSHHLQQLQSRGVIENCSRTDWQFTHQLLSKLQGATMTADEVLGYLNTQRGESSEMVLTGVEVALAVDHFHCEAEDFWAAIGKL